MDILQVTPYFAPAWAYGGPPRVVYDLSRHLVQSGHSVTVLTTDALDERDRARPLQSTIEGVRVHRLPNVSNRLAWDQHLFMPTGMGSFLRSHVREFDVIHLHMFRTLQNLHVHRSAGRSGTPYVFSAHGSSLRLVRAKAAKTLFDRLIGDRLLHDAARLVALSNREKSEYESVGIPAAKISVVFNGIDVADYANLPARGSFRRSLGLTDQRMITYLGRVHPQKGLDQLIAAFREVAERTDGCVLVIAGSSDGYKEYFARLAARLSISDRVLFPGFVSGRRKLELLVDSDLVVYPAQYEAFGLVPFEALLCGTPVVVSRDSGCGEIIEGAGAGITVHGPDVGPLRDALVQGLVRTDAVDEMVRRGRLFVLRELDWHHLATEMERVYELAASRNRAPAIVPS